MRSKSTTEETCEIEILTNIGDMEGRVCCSLGSLGSRLHSEVERGECLLVRAFGINTYRRETAREQN